VTHSIVVAGPASGSTDPFELTAFDVLQDILIDDITIATTTSAVGTKTDFVQFQMGDGSLVDEVPTDIAPEPGTFGLMAIFSVALFVATKRARSAA
jgi:hypothetical protein